LSSAEMRCFANLTGFDGGEDDWAVEYTMLCSSYSGAQSVISLALFEKLVDDETDDGCYCSDEELQGMATKLKSTQPPPPAKKPPAPAREPPARSPPQPKAAGPSPVVAADPGKMTRVDLIGVVFRSCDTNSDGFLNAQEMCPFARHIGFEGSDEEWGKEFATLCTENGSTAQLGIDVGLFIKLVEDSSDSGCYCTSKELRAMVKSKFAADVADTKRTNAPVVAPARIEKAIALFTALDTTGTGSLDMTEMGRFATAMGFTGDAEAWNEEYVLLFDGSNISPADGVSVQLFIKLVDDESDAGCFCTDDELTTLHERFQKQQPVGSASRIVTNKPPPGLSDPAVHASEEAWEWCTEADAHPIGNAGSSRAAAAAPKQRASGVKDPEAPANNEDWGSWDAWKNADEGGATVPSVSPQKAKRGPGGGAGSDAAWSGAGAEWWQGGQEDNWWAAGDDQKWSTGQDSWEAAGTSWKGTDQRQVQGKGASRGGGGGKGKGASRGAGSQKGKGNKGW